MTHEILSSDDKNKILDIAYRVSRQYPVKIKGEEQTLEFVNELSETFGILPLSNHEIEKILDIASEISAQYPIRIKGEDDALAFSEKLLATIREYRQKKTEADSVCKTWNAFLEKLDTSS